jgi:uncharacterized membrane protein YsdA (DUF1294 family)/cold shock CspA family protein
MRHQGKITDWKDVRGFGFITPESGGKKIFVYIKSFVNRQRRPVVNEIVTYDLKTDAKGRIQAESVAFLGERVLKSTSFRLDNFYLILALTFLVFISGLVFVGKVPFIVLGFYFVVSTVNFFVYAFDKSAAIHDNWRTGEGSLLFFGLIGGWPGALAAQRLLRHKTRKQSFQVAFWVTVALNCGALGWWLSSSDAKALHSVLDVSQVF